MYIHIGHQSRPVSRTSAELPVEGEYEYDYVIVPAPHVARVNPSEGAEGSNISLSTNISYNVII